MGTQRSDGERAKRVIKMKHKRADMKRADKHKGRGRVPNRGRESDREEDSKEEAFGEMRTEGKREKEKQLH